MYCRGHSRHTLGLYAGILPFILEVVACPEFCYSFTKFLVLWECLKLCLLAADNACCAISRISSDTADDINPALP